MVRAVEVCVQVWVWGEGDERDLTEKTRMWMEKDWWERWESSVRCLE